MPPFWCPSYRTWMPFILSYQYKSISSTFQRFLFYLFVHNVFFPCHISVFSCLHRIFKYTNLLGIVFSKFFQITFSIHTLCLPSGVSGNIIDFPVFYEVPFHFFQLLNSVLSFILLPLFLPFFFWHLSSSIQISFWH